MSNKAVAAAVVASSMLLAVTEGLAGNPMNLSPASPVAYVPGLGDIMGAIQMRHAKLWFAGKSRNWQLAAYELDEIREGFEEAATFQPDFKGHPVAQMVRENTAGPVVSLGKAIEARSPGLFTKAFEQLTFACNACHQAAGFGFISIKRPAVPPFSNQQFAPSGDDDSGTSE